MGAVGAVAMSNHQSGGVGPALPPLPPLPPVPPVPALEPLEPLPRLVVPKPPTKRAKFRRWFFPEKAVTILGLLVVAAGAYALYRVAEHTRTPGEFYGSSAIGAVVGATELVTRFKDNPLRLVKLATTYFYMLVNASASFVALVALHSFGDKSSPITEVFVSGFGAMLLLRSSFAYVEVAGTDVQAGPGGLISAMLSAIDNLIDRYQGRMRTFDARQIMENVSFEKAQDALPFHCLLMLNKAETDVTLTKRLERTVSEEIAPANTTDRVKAMHLGAAIIRVYGSEILRAAVETLGDEISTESLEPEPLPQPLPNPKRTWRQRLLLAASAERSALASDVRQLFVRLWKAVRGSQT